MTTILPEGAIIKGTIKLKKLHCTGGKTGVISKILSTYTGLGTNKNLSSLS
ncbi:hypothetical protein VCRA2122O12_410011 [Vibrio crassostreae]|nr:hypothetical protein VCRA2110O3_380011 [Vibrio crassostreae]CAK2880823.1 hypothetical protein VCRA2110O2_400009 [Vibrio crassostreae]CAK2929104.1 hypothetical protein VCRA2122O10_430011 [Vibrio crassostreae]CAK3008060.1 hypothetical protein VCRA2127O15_410002 [Vibrio crassostreae]CAK3499222.1 hypothetical protein VCRA2122O12_410011 [Vibrio crassostreae]